MSNASTEVRHSGKTVVEVVTDSWYVPAGLKSAFRDAGMSLLKVHHPGNRVPALNLVSDQAWVLVLVKDELPADWLDTLLLTDETRVLFLDWDGYSTHSVVAALESKLQQKIALPEESRTVAADGDGPLAPPQTAMPSTWLLAASIGGPEAMRGFLSRLPGDLPASLILAQHIGREFQDQLIRQLNQASALEVKLMEEGDRNESGRVLVVPSNRQIRLDEQGCFRLKAAGFRFTPCIDQVVAGLLPRLGAALGMIVFSGMSNDGVAGSHAVHVAGGPVWVQTPESCVVASMVEGTMNKTETGLAGSPEELADMLVSVYN